MNLQHKGIHFEPNGPGSPAWRKMLGRALSGGSWLIVTRTQEPKALVMDLLAGVANLPAVNEKVSNADFDRVAGAAERLYRMPISVVRMSAPHHALSVARAYLAQNPGGRALLQASRADLLGGDTAPQRR